MTAKPITDELWREYDFNGRVYRIDNPQELYVGNTTHRIVDKEGVVHCIPAPGTGNCVLRWKVSEGQSPVRF